MQRQPRIPDGRNTPVVALGPLQVVAFEDTRDLPVALGQQMSGQKIPAGVVIVRDTGHGIQLGTGAVEKEHGRAAAQQLLVELQVGVGQGGFAAFHPNARHRLGEQLL